MNERTRRDDAVDWLRGLVMLLMVLDHARDFFFGIRVRPLDLLTTTPLLFGTRWVTHFCAPVFVLLAGMAAYLYGRRKGDAARTRYLLSRGAFLILLEITVVRLLWVPDPFYHFTLIQVIWVLGWSMVILAGLSRLPRSVIWAFAVATIAGHQLLDGVHAKSFGELAPVWNLLHERAMLVVAPGHKVYVSYPLFPWPGVMALGYVLGSLLELEQVKRRRALLQLGAALTLGFVLVRALNVYGDPHPWSSQRTPLFTLLSFVNCEKYPPSLDFLLMTLGPALCVLALAPAVTARLPFVTTVGRAPMLFYLLHLLLLRVGAAVLALVRFGTRAFALPPAGTGGSPELSLGYTYLVWLVALLLLYPVCRWYAKLKATRPRAWMSYL